MKLATTVLKENTPSLQVIDPFLLNGIPAFMHQYINEIYNVSGDGNCGFRAIAVCLGLHEDEYMQIRILLHEELLNHQQLYQQLLSVFGHDYYQEILFGLIPDGVHWTGTGFAPLLFWMQFPAYGVLIATKFNRAVHFFSQAECSTYPPLLSSPTSCAGPPICIGLTNNHYFVISLIENSPLPPVLPLWRNYATIEARNWETILQPYTAGFLNLYPVKDFEPIELE